MAIFDNLDVFILLPAAKQRTDALNGCLESPALEEMWKKRSGVHQQSSNRPESVTIGRAKAGVVLKN